MANVKEATLNEIIREDSQSLYVMNMAYKNPNMGAGVIMLNIAVANEDPKPIFIPRTWAPFDISAQVPKQYVVNSTFFRSAVNKKALILMLSKDAEDYLANDIDAQMEFDRANQDLMGNNNFMADDDNSKDVKKRMEESYRETHNKLLQKQQKNQDSRQIDIQDSIDTKANLKIVEILARTGINEQEMYNLLRNHENGEAFTRDDADYILEICNYDKVRSFVANKMAKN